MNAQIDAVILGIVEGLTEFLPISSTGHLIVAENLLGYKDAGETFTVVIQMGAILAVIFFYWRLLLSKLGELFRGQPLAIRFWLNIVVACIPAAVIGLLFEKKIKSVLFTPTVVGIALIVGGIVLYVIEKRRARTVHAAEATQPDLDSITLTQALWVGVAQVFAVLFPGTSRSGASIVGRPAQRHEPRDRHRLFVLPGHSAAGRGGAVQPVQGAAYPLADRGRQQRHSHRHGHLVYRGLFVGGLAAALRLAQRFPGFCYLPRRVWHHHSGASGDKGTA